MWITVASVVGIILGLISLGLLVWVAVMLAVGICQGFYTVDDMLARHAVATLVIGPIFVLFDFLAAPAMATLLMQGTAVLSMLGILLSALMIEERHAERRKIWHQMHPLTTPYATN